MPNKTYSDGTTPSICIIGAGFGGLTTAIQLKRKLGLETFTIFEKRRDIGGAWLVNNYPGAACDIPSHLYSWSFEPNYEWSSFFAPQEEILEYMRSTAKKYNLYSHLKTNTSVISSIWREKLQKWEVTTLDHLTGLEVVTLFDFVIIGIGHLWNPNIPQIFENFKGDKMHTAEWDHSVDLTNKVVGVVGSGLSAIQVIPEIVNQAKVLHSIQRSPIWVGPKPLTGSYSKCFRWIQRSFPCLSQLDRWFLLGGIQLVHLGTKDNYANKIGKWGCQTYLKMATSKRDGLLELVKPSKVNVPLCRNIGTSPNYYSSLCRENVTVHREDVKSVTENALMLGDGTELKLDALILATGFKVQEFFGPIKIIGQEETDIMKSWRENRPTNYYGLCTTNAKNMFFILGPQSVFLHNSALFGIEIQVKYVTKLLSYMMDSGMKQCQIKADVEEEFDIKREKQLGKSVWGNPACKSTYPDGKGFNTFIFPGKGSELWKALRKVDSAKFNFA